MKFDVEIQHEGHTLRVTGSASPYIPATGPTMENAGGDPAEGGEIEDIEAFMCWQKGKGHPWRERRLCDKITESLDLEEAISEKMNEYCDDEPEPGDFD